MNPAKSPSVKLPYFDYLLDFLKSGDAAATATFGRHVHFGYWENPQQATLSTDDFAQATEALSAQVCQAGNVQNGLAVLDVGCGFGGTIAYMNEHYVRMGLVGLNLDERQLERARAKVIATAHNRVEFHQGDACTLPFPDQSFDVVLAVECIFHFPDRTQFFKEAHRVLKPGGYLALSDFLPQKQLLPFVPGKTPDWTFYGECHFKFSAGQYRQLAERCHFDCVLERDITSNSLPTYRHIRKLSPQLSKINSKSAVLETLGGEILSRLHWLAYLIYGFKKPA